MDTWSVWVMRPSGKPLLVQERAESLDAARSNLVSRGLLPLINAKANALGLSRSSRSLFARKPASHDQAFAQQLAVLLRSGTGPIEAIRALGGNATGDYQRCLAAVQQSLESGLSLADSLEATRRFDMLLVSLVRSAERTSNLSDALARFLDQHRRTEGIRRRIVTTSVYPILLMIVGAAVMAFLLFYVVPRFSGIFEGIRGELPWSAQMLLTWGQLLRDHRVAMATVSLFCATAITVLALNPGFRRFAQRKVLEFGWLGRQVRLLYLSRYYRTTGALLEGGIPLPDSMSMAATLLPVSLQHASASVLTAVREGRKPSDSFAAFGLSTAIASQLLQVGEKSGELGAMLLQIADFHDSEVAENLERLMRVLEPTVMAFVGVGIGIIVILMYLPIFELASAVQ